MDAGQQASGRYWETGRVQPEEVRFAVVLNGGVSLAVWMGGATMELDRLVKARRTTDDGGWQPVTSTDPAGAADPYAVMLALAGCLARVDVIAGTSAGGINGAALALAQVNRSAQVSTLRDVWVDQGQIDSLLREPFQGQPSSFLKGDEYFLPELVKALRRMALPVTPTSPSEAPIHLDIMTTVLSGNQTVTVDGLGQQLPQRIHGARFTWTRLDAVAAATAPDGTPTPDGTPAPTGSSGAPGSGPADRDPFSPGRIEQTAAELALAARSTASFPVAFEPSFIPVRTQPAVPAAPLRPDMSAVVGDWGSAEVADRSRFVVDGGVLANTPTKPALDAINQLPAGRGVRRIMLLVYPHAPAPGLDPADDEKARPSVVQAMSGVLGALTAQGSRTFVEEIEQHNTLSAARRGSRLDVISALAENADDTTGPDRIDLESASRQLFAHYRRLRVRRAARSLATRKLADSPWLAGADAGAGGTGPWNFERVRRAAEKAQQKWERTLGDLPYVPEDPPTAATVVPAGAEPTWRWGDGAAVAVAETVNDMLRELIWVVTDETAYAAVCHARAAVTGHIATLRRLPAELIDAVWNTDAAVRRMLPDADYWTLRLAYYAQQMVGLDGFVARAQDRGRAAYLTEATARLATLGPGPATTAPPTAATPTVPTVPTAPDTPDAATTGTSAPTAGRRVFAEVMAVVSTLRSVMPILDTVLDGTADPRAWNEEVRSLRDWRRILLGGDTAPVPDDAGLLARLLQLEVVTTALGDDDYTGSTIPIELVQLSAQTANPFTRYTVTADDKLGGMSLDRFGGFLKRSWRVNDWIWGRLDAATILCLTVLQPARLRRVALQSGYLAPGADAGRLAQQLLDSLCDTLFPDGRPGQDDRFASLVRTAVTEVASAFTLPTPTSDLPASMPALAGIFAWAVHARVVPEEVPTLAAAIRADHVGGADVRSHGEVFLEQYRDLIDQMDRATRHQSTLTMADRDQALAAFDRAGIGREALGQELSGDLAIRSTATAAAVAATVLDSQASGLGALKPVTKVLRGAMLVVYWAVVGLTSGAVLARTLAVLVLSLGGVLLFTGLLGTLPAGWAGPASLVGASAVLLAFAYGAARTRTLLHSLVLVSPVAPLIAFAVYQSENADKAGAAKTAATLLALGALTLGLMLLGSIPSTSGSVMVALGRFADDMGVPPGRHGTMRVAHALVRFLPRLVAPLLWVGVPVLVGWGVVQLRPASVAGWLRDALPWLVAAAVLLVVVGAVLAYVLGRRLEPVVRVARVGAADVFAFRPVAHPAGAQAGWSVLYAAVYLVVALVVTGWFLPDDAALWLVATVVFALVLGVVLALVVPVLGAVLALRGLGRAELERARTRWTAGPPDPGAYAEDLVDRGVGYRWLVDTAGGEGAVRLTDRGGALYDTLTRAHGSGGHMVSPQPGIRTGS